VIRGCHCIKIIPPLENISEFSLGSHRFSFLVGKQKRLFYQGWCPSLQSLQAMSTETSFLSSVEELKLNCTSFPSGFFDFSWCQNVPVLELRSITSTPWHIPSFPTVFSGKELKLTGFELSNWHEQLCFPNLINCQLDRCKSLESLPDMPLIARLSVNDCPVLSRIPSFPVLTHLTLNKNSILSTILYSPNLLQAEISNCPCVEDISGLVGVEKLEISYCVGLTCIGSFPKLKELILGECPNLSDLQHLSREWEIHFIQKKRVIRLYCLPALADLSFNQNIHCLELEFLSELEIVKELEIFII
jgi:hypothetical protein